MNKKKSDIGYIYVLSNPAMPGLLKIGFTQHSDTKRRILELSKNTAVPLHFVLEFEQLIENPVQYERLIHARLSQYRLSPDKEFFKIDLDTVEKIIRKIVFGSEDYSAAIELQHFVSLYKKHPDNFTGFDGVDELNKNIEVLVSEAKNDDDLIKKIGVLINSYKF
jgi:hypothetical protein